MTLIQATIERTGGVKGRSVSALVFAVDSESISLPISGGATDGWFKDAAGVEHSMLAQAVLSNLRAFHAADGLADGTKFVVPDLKTFYTFSVVDGGVIPGGFGKATTLTTDSSLEQRQALALSLDADNRTIRLCATSETSGNGKGARQAKALLDWASTLDADED